MVKEHMVVRQAATAALDKFAKNISVFAFPSQESMANYQLVCTAETERQAVAIADGIFRRCKTDYKLGPIGREGLKHGRWIILDYGFMIVHVMLNVLRDFYDLESFWQESQAIPWDYTQVGVGDPSPLCSIPS